MITTTFTCDRCGEEKHNDQMTTVSIYIRDGAGRPYGPASFGDYEHPVKSADWCRDCLKELGIWPVPPKPKEGEPEPYVATMEDIIREIVREELA